MWLTSYKNYRSYTSEERSGWASRNEVTMAWYLGTRSEIMVIFQIFCYFVYYYSVYSLTATSLKSVSNIIIYDYPTIDNGTYVASSASYIRYNNQHILNTRYVNYTRKDEIFHHHFCGYLYYYLSPFMLRNLCIIFQLFD